MATITTFEELDIWQLGREICQDVWDKFENSALGKDFELKNQMNRSSGSIMDNIAEGFEREGNKEFIQFLYYSKGSVGEIRSQLYRAFDNELIDEDNLQLLNKLLNPINIELAYFISYLKKSEFRGKKFK